MEIHSNRPYAFYKSRLPLLVNVNIIPSMPLDSRPSRESTKYLTKFTVLELHHLIQHHLTSDLVFTEEFI